ncbi:hypothetical protein [Pseudodesulfovibrio methanolicus]|uniref:Uncharacterized protein n=1 Tax=Pseudodesulfovibrio methanolicus TaxID=3126690 RepID=A0ABZ2IQT0_9BACT
MKIFNKVALFVGGLAALVGVSATDSKAALPELKAKEIVVTEQTPLVLTQPSLNSIDGADFQAWHSSHSSHASHASHQSHSSHYSSRYPSQ